jgi:hypothetical protein
VPRSRVTPRRALRSTRQCAARSGERAA